MKHPPQQFTTKNSTALYGVVFGSLFVRVFAVFLGGLFLMQPLAPVLAAESSTEPTPPAATTVEPEPVEVVAEIPVTETKEAVTESKEIEISQTEPATEGELESPSEIPTETESVEATASTASVVSKAESPKASSTSIETNPEPKKSTTTPQVVATAPPVTATTTASSSNPVSAGGSSTISSATTTAETGTASTSSSTAETIDETASPTPTPSINEDPVPVVDLVTSPVIDLTQPSTPRATSAPASSTEEVVTEAIQVVNNDQNRYQFGDAQCVSVGTESYYCSKRTGGVAKVKDGAFAEQDADGDWEIFMQEGSNRTKLTDNHFDDGAPHYDPISETVVFHRALAGRYQIISYDLNSKEERQLTDTRVNDMEPQRSGDSIVWQRWLDENWEIMMFDGDKETRITTNDYHDIAPTIRDGYIMWHTTNQQGEKMLSVYEIATGQSSLISDPDGGQVENPRFVLVYDTSFENGDSITKSYDPKTGAVSPVGSTPTSLPPEIPPADSTGETRALIQIKTSTRDEGSEEFDDGLGSTTSKTTAASSTPKINAASSTASTSPAAVASAPKANSTATATPTAAEETLLPTDLNLATASTSEPLVLTDFDLIVEPYDNSSTTDARETTDIVASSTELSV